jgi:hypothetical protein
VISTGAMGCVAFKTKSLGVALPGFRKLYDLVCDRLVAPVPEQLEDSQPALVAAHRLPLDHDGPDPYVVHRLHDQWIRVSRAVSVVGQQADGHRIAAGHQPVAVML